MVSSVQQKIYEIVNSEKNLREEDNSRLIISTVFADGLALLVAKVSAGLSDDDQFCL